MLMTVQIAPGERIAIDTVARQLGISQTPIREALSQLEAGKLVSKMPNVGYRASPRMTREEVQNLYALRLLIEPYAAARAAEKMDDETLATLQEIAIGMRGVANGDDRDFARFAEADAKLHRLIATGSGNHLIAETIERLHAHLQIFRSLYSTNAPEEAAVEHQRIIEALLAHDASAAETAVRVWKGRGTAWTARPSSPPIFRPDICGKGSKAHKPLNALRLCASKRQRG
jgi:DNA-binding GntR family transcriptional regulator